VSLVVAVLSTNLASAPCIACLTVETFSYFPVINGISSSGFIMVPPYSVSICKYGYDVSVVDSDRLLFSAYRIRLNRNFAILREELNFKEGDYSDS
jgi:hypothetical protein